LTSSQRKEFKGLYLHSPFCRSKCPYCDFYSQGGRVRERELLKALLKEFSLEKPELSQFPTVYFGGGTPSLLSPSFFEVVLSKVGQFSEVTVEFNPEDATAEKLSALRELGVNRVSLGVQSLSETTLKLLGRRQRVRENLKALEEAVKVFSIVSVDLIYGAPGQRSQEFLRELSFLTDNFPIKHFSLYALTLYPGTPMERAGVRLPPEEEVEECYREAVELLKSRGFKRYEVSNFALPGFECKHNLTYWKLENYLGLGPSAASFQEDRFWKKTSDFNRYAAELEEGRLAIEEEVRFGPKELLEVKVQMGMRLTEGVEVPSAEKLLEDPRTVPLIEEGFLKVEGSKVALGDRGFFVSNRVIAKVLEVLEGD